MGDGGRVGPRRHFSKSCRSGGGWVSKRHRPAGRIRRRRGSGRTRPAWSVGWRRSHHPTNRHRTARRPTWIRAPDIPVGTPPVPLGCSKACTGPRTPTRSRPLFGIDRDVCEPTNISWLRTAHPDTYDPRRASPTLIPKCPGREARTADVSSRSLGRPTVGSQRPRTVSRPTTAPDRPGADQTALAHSTIAATGEAMAPTIHSAVTPGWQRGPSRDERRPRPPSPGRPTGNPTRSAEQTRPEPGRGQLA
jgi:hypothetical protein